MPSNNRVIVSAAGSGKTTLLVNEAISKPDRRIALLTYTINNYNEIKRVFYQEFGSIPDNVTVMTWFTFLLRECARPYQNYLFDKSRIESIAFIPHRSAKFVKKTNVEKYYFSDSNIYTDKISEFSLQCNALSGGLVIDRLSEIFDEIYVDEIQDLAGYDLDFIEELLTSDIILLLVGDNRQATYSTNSSAKNNQYKGYKIHDLFSIWEKKGLCIREYLTNCYRCNQIICDFADQLYPDMPSTNSNNDTNTGHDGIFLVLEDDLDEYVKKYKPTVLRYDRRTRCHGYDALNFGLSKGLTFDRVLIFPNGPINAYLKSGNLKAIIKSRAKFYVGITRARYSVAFVFSEECNEFMKSFIVE